MASTSPLDVFGNLISTSLRDQALHRADALLNGSLKSPSTLATQAALQTLTPQQREAFRVAIRYSIDAGIHDFLFKLQELSERSGSMQVLVNGQDVAKLSDGLHGEAFSSQGWYARFSQFPSE